MGGLAGCWVGRRRACLWCADRRGPPCGAEVVVDCRARFHSHPVAVAADVLLFSGPPNRCRKWAEGTLLLMPIHVHLSRSPRKAPFAPAHSLHGAGAKPYRGASRTPPPSASAIWQRAISKCLLVSLLSPTPRAPAALMHATDAVGETAALGADRPAQGYVRPNPQAYHPDEKHPSPSPPGPESTLEAANSTPCP